MAGAEQKKATDNGAREPRVLGKYIVSDPRICHGKLTFRGTRILVLDILTQVADGMTWDEVVEDWDGKVSREAIAEAIRLAADALGAHNDNLAHKYVTR